MSDNNNVYFVAGAICRHLDCDLDQSKVMAAARYIAAQFSAQGIQEAEPVAWMLAVQTMGGEVGWKLSWSQSGAGVCDRLSGESHEKPLYTHPPRTAVDKP